MQQRRLMAIMFSDIVGYTAMMEKNEDDGKLKAQQYRTILEKKILTHDGAIIHHYGDGSLTTFKSSVEAVQCAKEVQMALKDFDIPVRIGIHLGDISIDDKDVYGDGVNIASRIESMGISGSILITKRVHEDIRNHLEFVTVFLGKYKLKNVSAPIEIFAIGVEGHPLPTRNLLHTDKAILETKKPNSLTFIKMHKKWIFLSAVLLTAVFVTIPLTRPSSNDQNDKSIAVLPFRDDSPEKNNEALCNGIQYELLNNLQKVADLNVKSATSAEQYRNPALNISKIGNALEVAYLLEGAVQKHGDMIRLHIQLIDTKTGDHLWAEKYDGKYSIDLLSFQSKAATKVVSSIEAIITPEEKISLQKIPTNDIRAYDYVIRGHHEILLYWRTLDVEHLGRAHNLYDQALRIDPIYLQALAGKGGIFMAENKLDSAIFYADKILSIDREYSDAYRLKADCYFFLGNYEVAIKHYTDQINLLPAKKVLWNHVSLGRAYGFTKDYTFQAIPHLKKGLEMDNEHLHAVYLTNGSYYLNMGYYDMAKAYFQKSLNEITGCPQISVYVWLLVVQGHYEEALQFLESMCNYQKCQNICHKYRFHIYLAQKEFEQAAIQINQLSKNGSTLYLGEGMWFKQHIGDSIMLAYLQKELGLIEESNQILDHSSQTLIKQLEKHSTWWCNFYLSMIHAIKEENDKALQYLSTAAALGFQIGWHDYINIHPVFENLRSNPQFNEIVKHAQNEKAEIRARLNERVEKGEFVL